MHIFVYHVISQLYIAVDGSVRWYAIGDWGWDDPQLGVQNKVADAMNEYSYDFKAEFIIALGDNFYQNGIHSVDDPRINL
jgi:hypothetical protein